MYKIRPFHLFLLFSTFVLNGCISCNNDFSLTSTTGTENVITARVIDSEGNSIENATLTLTPEGEKFDNGHSLAKSKVAEMYSPGIIQTQSDSNGYFKFSIKGNTFYSLEVYSPDSSHSLWLSSIKQDTDLGKELRLNKAYSVSLKIKSPMDSDIVTQIVTFKDSPRFMDIYNKDGIHFPLIPEGTHTLLQITEYSDQTSDTTEIEFTINEKTKENHVFVDQPTRPLYSSSLGNSTSSSSTVEDSSSLNDSYLFEKIIFFFDQKENFNNFPSNFMIPEDKRFMFGLKTSKYFEYKNHDFATLKADNFFVPPSISRLIRLKNLKNINSISFQVPYNEMVEDIVNASIDRSFEKGWRLEPIAYQFDGNTIVFYCNHPVSDNSIPNEWIELKDKTSNITVRPFP